MIFFMYDYMKAWVSTTVENIVSIVDFSKMFITYDKASYEENPKELEGEIID